MAVKYTEQEKQEIIKTLDVVLDDLEEIWNLKVIRWMDVLSGRNGSTYDK